MNQARFRRLERLEKRAQAYIERKREFKAETNEHLRRVAFTTIANLILIVLYGNPKIDEPLLYAWDRVRKSAAWQACRKEHPDFGEYGHEDQGDFGEYSLDRGDPNGNRRGAQFFDKSSGFYIRIPFDTLGAWYIARYFRKYILPELPGDNETEKLNTVFRVAPPWLVWFCFGDAHGRVLGLEPPDLSSISRFARGNILFDRLPEGPFECHRLPAGAEDKFYRAMHHSESKAIALPDNLTRRERRRILKIYEGRHVYTEKVRPR